MRYALLLRELNTLFMPRPPSSYCCTRRYRQVVDLDYAISFQPVTQSS
jgi:hypothetical protein